ncbi:glycoside hydrolase superfamily [Cyathus striatus]|nr:glycoside hydrolase superfamily [Cyathus striatus]
MSHYRTLSQREHVEMLSSGPPTPGQQQWAGKDDFIDMYRDQSSPIPINRSNENIYAAPGTRTPLKMSRAPRSRRTKWLIALAVLIVVAVAVAVPVALTSGKHKNNAVSSSGSNGSNSTSGGSKGGTSNGATNGTSGSVVTLDDGTTFTYVNDFGGDWAANPTDPFAAGGKAQSWSKRVGAEQWVWGTDVARGVNLGGWLVTEPFIVPALYEKYINTSSIAIVDEWTLSIAMGANLAKEMEDHYKTFITEQDFADIAAAGLNWVRIPIGFWAIETINDEPFLVGTSWSYFLKAIQWARKYGIRIYLDLHALPGSQNGWNHSGKFGTVNFMHGVMGIANAQRTLTYLRILTEFVSQDQYRDVVGIVGIVNEILWATIGEQAVQSFYYAAYEAIRKASGNGAGAGPYIAIHEGFQGPAIWEGFLAGADRIALDQHPYLAFMNDQTSTLEQFAAKACSWAIATNQSSKAFGVTVGGEFSTAINDCGLWLSGIGSTPQYPNCAQWDNWSAYTPSVISSLKEVTLASMDALQNFFFWTWKIGNSTVLNTSSSPLWHYQLGLQQGWVPKDPRDAIGKCASVLGSAQIFDGNYPATATGSSISGGIDAAQTSSHAFPPPTISPTFSGNDITLLPTYTATGTIKTLFAPTFTSAPSAAVGVGWANSNDRDPAYVPVAGCQYPNAWDAVNATLPTSTCTGA